jgi:hypothetical protein
MFAALLSFGRLASAQSAAEPAAAPAASSSPDTENGYQSPNVAYAYSASGAAARTVGAQAYGLGVGAGRQRTVVGGGVTAWGSPLDRLTIIGNAERDVFGDFAPSLAVIGRLFGRRSEGWSLGALGKLKMEGFGGGSPAGAGTPPKTPGEIEGEIETGLLASYNAARIHLDLNAIVGMGTGDDGEVDSEGRVRVGYDVARIVRLGLDSQARARLHGPRYLPNGRVWDFAAGLQAMLGTNIFFGTLTAGPATMGLLSDRLGWNAIVSVGGTTR